MNYQCTRPSNFNKYLKYNWRLHKHQRKSYHNGKFSSVSFRHNRSHNAPYHPSQPGMVLIYYWKNYFNNTNRGPVDAFARTTPIGRRIRQCKNRIKLRKRVVPRGDYSGLNRFSYKHTTAFDRLMNQLNSRSGMKLNLSFGPSWIHELGKTYPFIGG